MTSYDKIVKWHVEDNPSFMAMIERNRFYYADIIFDDNANTIKLKYKDQDNEWKHIESKYLCTFIDAIILDMVFVKGNHYNKNYFHFNPNIIPKICGHKIADNPNLNEILDELSSHYDRRGFFNIIKEEKYNKTIKTLNIMFFKGLPINPKTMPMMTTVEAEETFEYKKRLLYVKLYSDKYVKTNSDKSFYLTDENTLNDRTYKFIIDRNIYNSLWFTYHFIINDHPEFDINVTYYCHDTPIFTINRMDYKMRDVL